MIAVPVAPAPPALVRMQEGPGPARSSRVLRRPERYVRSKLRFPRCRFERVEVRVRPQLDRRLRLDAAPDCLLRQLALRRFRSRLRQHRAARPARTTVECRGDVRADALPHAGSAVLSKGPYDRRPISLERQAARCDETAAAGRARASGRLQMPSRNIGCMFTRSPQSVRCDVRPGLRPASAAPEELRPRLGLRPRDDGDVTAAHVLRGRHSARARPRPCLRRDAADPRGSRVARSGPACAARTVAATGSSSPAKAGASSRAR